MNNAMMNNSTIDELIGQAEFSQNKLALVLIDHYEMELKDLQERDRLEGSYKPDPGDWELLEQLEQLTDEQVQDIESDIATYGYPFVRTEVNYMTSPKGYYLTGGEIGEVCEDAEYYLADVPEEYRERVCEAGEYHYSDGYFYIDMSYYFVSLMVDEDWLREKLAEFGGDQ